MCPVFSRWSSLPADVFVRVVSALNDPLDALPVIAVCREWRSVAVRSRVLRAVAFQARSPWFGPDSGCDTRRDACGTDEPPLCPPAALFAHRVLLALARAPTIAELEAAVPSHDEWRRLLGFDVPQNRATAIVCTDDVTTGASDALPVPMRVMICPLTEGEQSPQSPPPPPPPPPSLKFVFVHTFLVLLPPGSRLAGCLAAIHVSYRSIFKAPSVAVTDLPGASLANAFPGAFPAPRPPCDARQMCALSEMGNYTPSLTSFHCAHVRERPTGRFAVYPSIG